MQQLQHSLFDAFDVSIFSFESIANILRPSIEKCEDVSKPPEWYQHYCRRSLRILFIPDNEPIYLFLSKFRNNFEHANECFNVWWVFVRHKVKRENTNEEEIDDYLTISVWRFSKPSFPKHIITFDATMDAVSCASRPHPHALLWPATVSRHFQHFMIFFVLLRLLFMFCSRQTCQMHAPAPVY